MRRRVHRHYPTTTTTMTTRSSNSSSLYMLKTHTTVGQSHVSFDFSIGSLSQETGLDFEVLDVYDLPPEDEPTKSDESRDPVVVERKPWRFSLTKSYMNLDEVSRHAYQLSGSDITAATTAEQLRLKANGLLKAWFAPRSSSAAPDIAPQKSGRASNALYFGYLNKKPDLYYERADSEEGPSVRFVLVLPPGFCFTVTHPSLLEFLGLPVEPAEGLDLREVVADTGERSWSICNNDNDETLVYTGTPLRDVGLETHENALYPYVRPPTPTESGDSPSSPQPGVDWQPAWRSNAISLSFGPMTGYSSVHSIELAADDNHPADPDADVALDVLSQCLPLLLEESNLAPDVLTARRSSALKDNLVISSKTDWTGEGDSFFDYDVPLLLKLGWNESSASSFRLSTRKNFVVFRTGFREPGTSYYAIHNYVSRYELGPFPLAGAAAAAAATGEEDRAKKKLRAAANAEASPSAARDRSTLRSIAPYAIVTAGSDSCDYVNDKGFVHVLAYADESGRLQTNSPFSSRLGQDRLSIHFLNSAFRDYVFKRRRLICMLLRASPAVRPPWTRSLMTLGEDSMY